MVGEERTHHPARRDVAIGTARLTRHFGPASGGESGHSDRSRRLATGGSLQAARHRQLAIPGGHARARLKSALVRLVGHGPRGAAAGKKTGGLILPVVQRREDVDRRPPLTYSRTGSTEMGQAPSRIGRMRGASESPRSSPPHLPIAKSAYGNRTRHGENLRSALLPTYKPHGRPRNGTRPGKNLPEEHARPCARHTQTARKSCAHRRRGRHCALRSGDIGGTIRDFTRQDNGERERVRADATFPGSQGLAGWRCKPRD